MVWYTLCYCLPASRTRLDSDLTRPNEWLSVNISLKRAVLPNSTNQDVLLVLTFLKKCFNAEEVGVSFCGKCIIFFRLCREFWIWQGILRNKVVDSPMNAEKSVDLFIPMTSWHIEQLSVATTCERKCQIAEVCGPRETRIACRVPDSLRINAITSELGLRGYSSSLP